MSKKSNIIEINGQRYDTSSGMPLAASAKTKTVHRAVDGISAPVGHVKPTKYAAARTGAHKPHPHVSHSTRHSSSQDVTRRPAKTSGSHTPQPSRTLMRGAVKKPASGLKRRVKAHGSIDKLTKRPHHELDIKPSIQTLDAKRLQHARHVAKSHLVSRFSDAPVSIPAGTPLLVPHPVTPPLHVPKTKTKGEKPKTSADLLEHALKHAASHQQAPPKKRRRFNPSRRITSISALVLAIAVLAGFVGVQNLSTIRLRVASSKAGFVASLPGYQPSGYRLSHLNYSAGEVALHFQSNSDSRAYTITEKTSILDSDTLRDMVVASSNQQYQTVALAGRTVYIYGQQDATWVNSGVWYQVQTDGSLTNHQLSELATSM